MKKYKSCRACGILFPVSSLASRYGIGCFSEEALEFVDFLAEAGQTYWQVLPFGPTGYGDSPYQSFSAFAGNPYFIDPEQLKAEGLLYSGEIDGRSWGNDCERVDYGAQYTNRFEILHIAFDRFEEKFLKASEKEMDEKDRLERRAFEAFRKQEAFWLEDYCLYMSLKQKKYEGKSWQEWDKEDKLRKPAAMKKARAEYEREILFNMFQQYEFMKQWQAVRDYAAAKKIRVIGDISFYVAMDSADSWSHPEAFKFDKDLAPEVVAGCPPDAFSEDGQLWGNPVYDWEARKKGGYSWWMERIRRSYRLFDVIRFDHFHGFESYYEIPYEDTNAKNGTARKGPGMDFFNVVNREFAEVFADGGIHMIAEDLGINTPAKEKLLADSGLPGMKILQFAFDWTESSIYLPYQHIRNCVVYTGTHDNETSRAWIEHLSDHDRDFVRRYIHSENSNYGQFVWDFIREAYRSAADTCIIPLQDYLVLGNEARINAPGTQTGNWQWRLKPNFLSHDLARSVRELAQLYGRLPKEPVEEENEEAPEE